MDREPPESRLKMELDRLSNLPNELIEKILLSLPIREAVRTSVLSTKWRKKPAMLPDLWFDKRCISSTTKKTIGNVVDHVLLGHIGPIRMFTLCNENELSREDMDRWILHLSRNGITDFRLNWKGRLYKIPSCLLACEDLNALALGKCLIKPPPTFVGFKNLSQLSLTKVGLAGDVLENLILRCPNLENLVLNDCAGFNHLKIDAPNLVYLWVKGVFKHVSLGNTKLNHVAVTLNGDVANDQRMAPRSSSNLLNVLGKLPRIQLLYVNSFFLKYLGVGAVPGKLPNPLEYLKSLLIEIEFHDHKGILTTICLLRSSPALQELEIAAPSKKVAVGEVNYASEENRNCQFSQLRRVRILGISAVRGELDFVQFLLSSSPVLERMTVKPFSNNDVLELLKHLVQFRRASAKAEIILD